MKSKLFLSIFFLLVVLAVATYSTQAQGIVIPTDTGLPDGSVTQVLDTILNWLLKIFIIIATISFVITGLQFIFSFGGASGSEAQAKKNFAYTIIAIFIVGGSLIILKTVIGLLGPSTGGDATTVNYGTEENPNYGTIDDNWAAVDPTPTDTSSNTDDGRTSNPMESYSGEDDVPTPGTDPRGL